MIVLNNMTYLFHTPELIVSSILRKRHVTMYLFRIHIIWYLNKQVDLLAATRVAIVTALVVSEPTVDFPVTWADIFKVSVLLLSAVRPSKVHAYHVQEDGDWK